MCIFFYLQLLLVYWTYIGYSGSGALLQQATLFWNPDILGSPGYVSGFALLTVSLGYILDIRMTLCWLYPLFLLLFFAFLHICILGTPTICFLLFCQSSDPGPNLLQYSDARNLTLILGSVWCQMLGNTRICPILGIPELPWCWEILPLYWKYCPFAADNAHKICSYTRCWNGF